MTFLRSLLFQIYFFASVVVAGTGVLLTAPFPGNGPFRITRGWCRGMLLVGKYVCGLDYVVEGAENIPDEPSVVMIKHASVFEVYAQVVVFPQQVWVLKRELFLIPFFGWGLLALKPIAIDRKAGRTAVKQVIEQGQERLAEGLWVTVFPEGTRVQPGETKKYGISGAALAHAAGAKIVPVAHNAGDSWPRRSLLKRPGHIRFCIGPPIDASAQPPKETNVLVQSWIEGKMAEISSAYQQRGAESAPGSVASQTDDLGGRGL